MRQACAVVTVIVFKSIHRIGVDRRKRCENATSGQDFFRKTDKKKLRFQTNTATCGQGLRENVEN